MFEYYLKINRSCFDSGFTIPKEYEECFIQNLKIQVSKSREIKLIFKNKEYEADIRNASRKKGKPYYTLRFRDEFKKILKKEFIYSYVRYEDDFQKDIKNKYYNEVLKIKAINPFKFQLEVFIKKETEFKHLFSKLIEEDFFSWLKPDEKDTLIVSTSNWVNISDLTKHKDRQNVIYYLIDEKKNEIYIGSADILGNRVKPNRKEIPGWTKFRYDIIKPEYKHLKQRIENQIINAFAMMLNSNIKYKKPFIITTDYKLVNKVCGKSHSTDE